MEFTPVSNCSLIQKQLWGCTHQPESVEAGRSCRNTIRSSLVCFFLQSHDKWSAKKARLTNAHSIVCEDQHQQSTTRTSKEWQGESMPHSFICGLLGDIHTLSKYHVFTQEAISKVLANIPCPLSRQLPERHHKSASAKNPLIREFPEKHHTTQLSPKDTRNFLFRPGSPRFRSADQRAVFQKCFLYDTHLHFLTDGL